MAENDTSMADPTPTDTASVGRGNEYPGLPSWVKVSGIIVLIAALLAGIILFSGIGGPHGPGRHMPSGGLPSGTVGYTPPSSTIEHREHQPWS